MKNRSETVIFMQQMKKPPSDEGGGKTAGFDEGREGEKGAHNRLPLLPLSPGCTVPAPLTRGAKKTSLLKVAQRRRGNEFKSGGLSEPRRDRAAARR